MKYHYRFPDRNAPVCNAPTYPHDDKIITDMEEYMSVHLEYCCPECLKRLRERSGALTAEAFISKFVALLQEYDAGIRFSCGPGSDVSGLSNAGLEIFVGDYRALFTPDWWMTAASLLEELEN